MILDTSAVVAIFEREPEAEAFLTRITESDAVGISTVSVVESGMGCCRLLSGGYQEHR